MAVAEQFIQRQAIGDDRVGIEGQITAHFAGAIIANEQADGAAFGLRLQRHLAAVAAQDGAEQRRHHQRLGEQPRQRRRVGMRRQHGVERRIEPDHLATDVARRHAEPQRSIGNRGHTLH